jgi:hypothetical protein
MKKAIVVILVCCGWAFGGDNCYIHERGSESWMACKEQAGQNAAKQAELDSRLQGIMNETNQAVSTKLQMEQVLRENAPVYPYDGTLRADPVRVSR